MIGILDANLGGLILTKEIISKFPEYQILYFADTATSPFGNKGNKIIKKRAEQGINFLVETGAKIIIVSDPCMAIALKNIKTKTLAISLMDWLIDCAVKESQNKKIGVIASRAVINSNFAFDAVRQTGKNVKVFTKITPLLLPLIKESWLKKSVVKRILKTYLHNLRCEQIDTLVLTDPAYSLLQDIIQIKIGKQVKIISPISIITPYLQKFLEDKPEIKKDLQKGRGKSKFFVSDASSQVKTLASQWFGRKIQLQEV